MNDYDMMALAGINEDTRLAVMGLCDRLIAGYQFRCEETADTINRMLKSKPDKRRLLKSAAFSQLSGQHREYLNRISVLKWLSSMVEAYIPNKEDSDPIYELD